MASTFTTLVGAPPNAITAFNDWMNWYREYLNARVAYNNDVPRAATYYFSNSEGSDSNDGTIESPYQTLAKAQTVLNASSGNIAVLFKRGDEWNETTGLVLSQAFQLAGAYGQGAEPLFNRFTEKYNQSGWTNASGDRWTRAETDDIAWVRDQLDRFNAYTHATDAAACEATARSFFWGANVLHINAGTGIDPNDLNLEAVISNIVSGVNLTADGTVARDIEVHGADMHRTTVSPQQYCFRISTTGTDSALVMNCKGYYSSTHAIAQFSAGTGGFGTFVNCKAGYTKKNGTSADGGETIFNSYSDNGSHETIFHNCECTYGSLPSDDWISATNLTTGDSMYAHTTTGTISLIIAYGHTTKANKWGAGCPIRGFGNLPTASAVTDVRGFNIGEVFEENNTAGLGFILAPTSMFEANGSIYLKPKNSGFAGVAVTTASGWAQNMFVQFDMTNITETAFAIWNPGGVTMSPHIYNSHVHAKNYSVSTGIYGMIYNTVVSNSNIAPSGEFKNSIMTIENFTGATTAKGYMGFNNSAAQCTNNAYFGLTQDAGANRGYDLHANKVALSAQPKPLLPAYYNSQLYHAGTDLDIYYDAKLSPREATPSIGPIDELPYQSGINFKTNLLTPIDTDKGNVFGANNAIDNAIPRYDGVSGRLIQTSRVTISDIDLITAPGGMAITAPLDGSDGATVIDVTVPLGATTFGVRLQGYYTDALRFDGEMKTSDPLISNFFAILDNSLFSPTDVGKSAYSFGTALITAGNQNIPLVMGFFSNPTTRATGATYSGTITDMYAYESQPVIRSGTVTNLSYFHGTAPAIAGTGAVTNLYGLYLPDISGASTVNLSIRTGLGKVSFGDDLIFSADNTDDIGASGATRPRTGYFGTSVIAPNLTSTVATGTAPLTITSTTVVTNLNADMLDGAHVGTSGATVPLLSTANTFGTTQTITNADGSSATLNLRTYKSSTSAVSSISVGSAQGTLASPTAIQNGDTVGSFVFNGYQGGFFRIVAQITASATENYTASARGTQYSFASVNDGTTSNQTKLTLNTTGVTVSNPFIQYPITDSTTSAYFMDSTQTNYVLNVDTTNTRVGVNTNAPGSTLDVVGSFQCDSITNDTGLAHGTYTPTLTNTTNVAASTPRLATYMRVGNTVTVAGQLDIDPTGAGAVVLGISLPIASNFSTVYQAGGTASSMTIANESGGIEADGTNDRVSLKYVAVDTSNHAMAYTFSYQVI